MDERFARVDRLLAYLGGFAEQFCREGRVRFEDHDDRLTLPGTILSREYKGRTMDGCEWAKHHVERRKTKKAERITLGSFT
jgi:hypothetical protein